MNEKNSAQGAGLKNRIANFAHSRKVQMGVVVVVTATTTAIVTRQVTLKKAFTFPQMASILSDEELTQSLVDATKSAT